MLNTVPISDQPISSTFFGQGKWLTDFITPGNGDVQKLYQQLTEGKATKEEKATACWHWVASEVRYIPYVKARLQIDGLASIQKDYWAEPSLTLHTRVGNCANKAFLLTSLLRNCMSDKEVQCVLGNLCQNGQCGGHAWVQVYGDGIDYIMESTRSDMPAFVPAEGADIYEPVVLFNDMGVEAVPGRTLLTPFAAVYVSWLRDYLNWAYIKRGSE